MATYTLRLRVPVLNGRFYRSYRYLFIPTDDRKKVEVHKMEGHCTEWFKVMTRKSARELYSNLIKKGAHNDSKRSD